MVKIVLISCVSKKLHYKAKAKDIHKDKINLEKQKEIEKKVTKYMQDNFSFVVFEILEKEDRQVIVYSMLRRFNFM